ncbi:MAG: PPOX class F420-dependent oxidoreductase [Candidatus Dormibacteraeota bacterium]|nr:PPOX class F420-dependent oxidoreductase [Candidatus Dormibacteraeota bacterium]
MTDDTQPAGRLDEIAEREFISLTTFKRDGRGVATPVWFVLDGGRVYFRSPVRTGKVKRIRANPAVSFFASDDRGLRVGPSLRGTARLAPESRARVAGLLNAKYGLYGRLFALSLTVRLGRQTIVEILPG